MITRQADAHLANWLKARFNLTVQQYMEGHEFMAFEGDYDLDCSCAVGDTVFAAALEFASCYRGAMFDELVAIELGA